MKTRNTFLLVSLTPAIALVFAGCFGGGNNHNNNSMSDGGSDTGSGGEDGEGGDSVGGTLLTGGSSSGGTSSGGSTSGGSSSGGSSSGGSSSGGSGGSSSGTCTSDPLTVDNTGWVDGTSNGCGIQGAWFWFMDEAGTTVTDATAAEPPYRGGGSGMCLTGTTPGIVDAYGAVIGLNFYQEPEMTAVSYDAASHGIVGFTFEITGTFTQTLRVGFTPVAMGTMAPPFVPVETPGTVSVLFEDAIVPSNWTVPNAGETVNPSSVYALNLFVAGDVAGDFDVCIKSIAPIVE